MMKTRLSLLVGVIITALSIPAAALAHCPLCTAGVGLAALAAYKIGVSGLTIGVMVGAFAWALGLWLGKIIRKKIFPVQNQIVAVASWLLTVLPLQGLLSDYTSIYFSRVGPYGTWYPVNLFLVGGIIGAVLVYLAGPLSLWLGGVRGKKFPFQTMIITIALVIVAALIAQFAF